MKRVLEGLRVVELAGIGPSPHAAMLLAEAQEATGDRAGAHTPLPPWSSTSCAASSGPSSCFSS